MKKFIERVLVVSIIYFLSNCLNYKSFSQESSDYSNYYYNLTKSRNFDNDFVAYERELYSVGLFKEKVEKYTAFSFVKNIIEDPAGFDIKKYPENFKNFATYIKSKITDENKKNIIQAMNNYIENRNYFQLLIKFWDSNFWIFEYQGVDIFSRNSGKYSYSNDFELSYDENQQIFLLASKFIYQDNAKYDSKLKNLITKFSFKTFYKDLFYDFNEGVPKQIQALLLIELLEYFEKLGCTELYDAYWDGDIGPSKIPIKHRRKDLFSKLFGLEEQYISLNCDSIKTNCLDLSSASASLKYYKILNFLDLHEGKVENEFDLFKLGDSIFIKRQMKEWDRESVNYFKEIDNMKLSSEELLKYENYENTLKEQDEVRANLISKIENYLNLIYRGNSEKFKNVLNESMDILGSPILPSDGEEDFINYPMTLIKEIYESPLKEINNEVMSMPKDSTIFLSFITKYVLIEDLVKMDSSRKNLFYLNLFYKKINQLISDHYKDFEKNLTKNHLLLIKNLKTNTSNSVMEEVDKIILTGKTGALKLSGTIFYTGIFYDRGPAALNFPGAGTINFIGAYVDYIGKRRIDVQVNGKLQYISKYNYKVVTPNLGEFFMQLKQDECGEVKLLARGKQRNAINFVFDVN